MKVGFDVRAGCMALVASALALISPPSASIAVADGTFINAPGRVDIAYDDSRGFLYITSGEQMLRYQLSTQSFETPVTITGANLYGIDISPDGSTAAIADTNYGSTYSYVHFVDLDTLNVKTADFPLDSAGGTYTVAYGGDGKLLVSSEEPGSGAIVLWHYNPKTGAETSPGFVQQNTMLTPAANGKFVAIAQSDTSGGPFGYYNFKAKTLDQNGLTNQFNFEIGVNRDATLYALPTYVGAYIADQNLYLTGTVIGNESTPPVAAAFHPKKHLAYFPFAGTTDVEVYNTKTWTLVKSYNFEDNFQWNGNFAFVQGRTKLSRDGSLLFVTVTNGVRYVNTVE